MKSIKISELNVRSGFSHRFLITFLVALLGVFVGFPAMAALVLDGLTDETSPRTGETEWATYGVARDYSGFVPGAEARLIIIDSAAVDADNIWLSWRIANGYNDNSYEDTDTPDGQHSSWPQGHGFFDLVESDKLSDEEIDHLKQLLNNKKRGTANRE